MIKIDHHPNDDAYGDLLLVEPERSSASEIVADFAFENGLNLNKEAARLPLCRNYWRYWTFLISSNFAQYFKVASKLAEYPFDRPALGREMSSFDMKVARLQGFVYENMEVSENGAARVLLTQEILKNLIYATLKLQVLFRHQEIFEELNHGQSLSSKPTDISE